jgi:hypothetical protein
MDGDQQGVALDDAVTLNVAVRNDGSSPVFIYRRMGWGPHGGLNLIVHDSKGNPVDGPVLDDTLIPPSEKPIAELLVKLENGEMFGVKRDIELHDMVRSPGKYTVTVEYSSILDLEFLDKDAQVLPVLLRGHPILSKPLTITVSQSPRLKNGLR